MQSGEKWGVFGCICSNMIVMSRYTNNAVVYAPFRWYRYRCGLCQRDIADYAGIDRGTYSGYEEFVRDYYPIEKMLKIAKLFSVPVTELLDEYNLFLYNGQGA